MRLQALLLLKKVQQKKGVSFIHKAAFHKFNFQQIYLLKRFFVTWYKRKNNI